MQQSRFEGYVKGIVGHFANDNRILAWDVWNELDNPGGGNYTNNLKNKVQLTDDMLPRVFEWARSVGANQPLTRGLWQHDRWDEPTLLSETEKNQLAESDIISFHDYSWPEKFAARILQLERLHRPVLCTEFMARGSGSTFDESLPIAARHHVGAISWGLVQGLSQTWLPWDSWQVPYTNREPPVWFHDIFYPEGKPYRQAEIDEIRRISAHTSNAPAHNANSHP